MWKLAIGFVAFAALAVYMLSKGGDIDMGGEKHEINVPHTPAPAAATAPSPNAAGSAPSVATPSSAAKL